MHKFIAPLLIASSFALTGCPADEIDAKVNILVDDLTTNGMAITLSGDLGSGTLPFDGPINSAPTDGTLALYIDDAVQINIESDTTGTTASFGETGVKYVEDTPAAPGEYTWELNAARDAATFTFFNQTPGGVTLKTTVSYTAELSVSNNP
ncbi:MAG: hypothetical protein ACPHRO_00630, partial [Nannocystaceae bacterium]